VEVKVIWILYYLQHICCVSGDMDENGSGSERGIGFWIWSWYLQHICCISGDIDGIGIGIESEELGVISRMSC